MLNKLNQSKDEQNFHVVAVDDSEHLSQPSETISFYKSELISHLSDFYEDNRFLDTSPTNDVNNHNNTNHINNHENNDHDIINDHHQNKDMNNNNHHTTNNISIADNLNHKTDFSTISLSEHFAKEQTSLPHPKIIARVLKPYHLNDKHTLNLNQLICVERDQEGRYVVCLQGDEGRYHIPEHLLCPVPTVKKVVALYEYVPQQMSPNTDCYNELSFKTGDVILIFEEERDGLFYKVCLLC